MCHELDQPPGAGRKGLARWADDFEVNSRRRPGIDGAELPGRCLSNTYLRFSNTSRLLSG